MVLSGLAPPPPQATKSSWHVLAWQFLLRHWLRVPPVRTHGSFPTSGGVAPHFLLLFAPLVAVNSCRSVRLHHLTPVPSARQTHRRRLPLPRVYSHLRRRRAIERGAVPPKRAVDNSIRWYYARSVAVLAHLSPHPSIWLIAGSDA